MHLFYFVMSSTRFISYPFQYTFVLWPFPNCLKFCSSYQQLLYIRTGVYCYHNGWHLFYSISVLYSWFSFCWQELILLFYFSVQGHTEVDLIILHILQILNIVSNDICCPIFELFHLCNTWSALLFQLEIIWQTHLTTPVLFDIVLFILKLHIHFSTNCGSTFLQWLRCTFSDVTCQLLFLPH